MKQKTILVIEDEMSLLKAVTAKLEKSNFRVITSRSVHSAFATELEKNASGGITQTSIELALKHLEALEEVDAIWLDHNLLGTEDGLDFITKLKANGGRWSTVPIFVVSNTSDPELVKTYAKLGIPHYYIKAEHRLEDIISDITKTLDTPKK